MSTEEKNINFKKPLISVIVPVYNAEPYLRQCIESIVGQTYSQLQILLMDDGSTDGSGDICREYEARDERIRYIRIPNGGVSHARNVGLDYATGEYVTFVDADDYLDRNILKTVSGGVLRNQLKILQFNMYFDYPCSIMPNRKLYCDKASLEELYASIISGYENEELFLSGMVRCVWGKIFQRAFLESVHARFDEELYIGEDALFILKLLRALKAEEFGAVNEYGYYYRRHQESAVHRYKRDLYVQLVGQADVLEALLEEKYGGELPQLLQDAYRAFLWVSLFSLDANFRTGAREGRLRIWQADEDVRRWMERHKAAMLGITGETVYQLDWRGYKAHRFLSGLMGRRGCVKAHLYLQKCICAARFYFSRTESL